MSRLTRAFLAALMIFSACGDDIRDSTFPAIEYDREVTIPGQDGPVSALYDAQGVLNLQCTTDADCLAAQGYFHAADRFFQMDLRRRFARGKLSELAGPLVLDIDHERRTIIATRDGGRIEDQMWASATPETRAAVQAYTRGVNAWIEDLRNERNGARLSAEYDFMIIDKTRIDDWDVLDSIACFLPVIEQLTNHSSQDLLSGEAAAILAPAMAGDLFGVAVASPSTIAPSSQATRGAQAQVVPDLRSWASVLRQARQFAGAERATTEVGSNNWIVGPSKAGGKALLANDPHLTLSNPAIWYLVHIDAKTRGEGKLHIAGASFAGVPGILFGQNENLAWGVTTTFFDQSDVYLETLNAAGDAVIFNGNEVPIVDVEQTYQVSGAADTTRIAKYVPHHGPVLAIDTAAGTASTLRWTAQDADTDFNFLWKMWTAQNTAEAREALLDITTVGQNFVIADTEGDIGWYPYNRVPSRPWMSATPSWLPLPGDGSAEWGPYIDYADLPQATSPASGYVATANNDMTGALLDGDPSNDGQAAAQAHVAAGFRHERITEILDANDDLTLQDMQAIQHDTKSLYGERITPLVVSDANTAAGLSTEAMTLLTMLQEWDFFCPTGYDDDDVSAPVPSTDAAIVASARGCAAFHVLWPRLRMLTFGDELRAAGADFPIRDQPMAIAFLRPGDLRQTYWDDVSTQAIVETRADIVAAALEQAGAYLTGELGADPDAWRWGALHTVYMPADLFDQAGVTEFSNGPFMHDGGLATVDVASPRNDLRDDYGHSHGASIRLTCEVDSDVACHYQLPGGQRHHRADPFYNSLLERWLSHTSVPLPFSIREVIGASVDSVKVNAGAQ